MSSNSNQNIPHNWYASQAFWNKQEKTRCAMLMLKLFFYFFENVTEDPKVGSIIFLVNGTFRYLQKTCVLLFTAGVFIHRYRWVSAGQLHCPSSFPGVPICTCVLALRHGTQPWARSAPFFNQPCSTPALTLLAETVVPAQ